MRLIIHSLVGCHPCEMLCGWLERENVPFIKKVWDPSDGKDVLKMSQIGIYDMPFPVVIVDGSVLDPAEPSQYYDYIMKRCGKR